MKVAEGKPAICGSITTLEFLQLTLPDDGVKYLALMQKGRSGLQHVAFTDISKMAEAMRGYDAQPDITVYHACAAYKSDYIFVADPKNAGQTKKEWRTAENRKSAKAFWIDIDCGPEKAATGKGYVTQKAALTALTAVLRETELPVPFIINSGYGLHCYWCLETEIDPAEWQRIAGLFKAIFAHFKLIVDDSRTIDMASVLRPVGSHNKKGPTGFKAVTALNKALAYSLENITNILGRIISDIGIRAGLESGTAMSLPTVKAEKFAGAMSINADVLGVAGPVDAERAAAALMSVPSDLPRAEWIKVVMGYNTATEGANHEILRHWCAQSADKYPDWETELDKVIRSDKMDGRGVGAGTLFLMARKHGWIDSHQRRTAEAAEPHPAQRTAVMETLNDAGNADRIVKAANGHLRYCKDFLLWLVWHDGHWRWDTKGGVVQFATSVMRSIYDEAKTETRNDDAKRLAQHASSSLSHKRIMAALELAKACAGIAVSASELDADPWMVGVRNGVVELRTGRFRTAHPDDLITCRMNVDYVAGATCPTWETTLDAVFCESRNVADFFHRAAGYSMTGITSEQCFFFLYGSGANGKSTVLNVMREVMGGYGIQTQPDVLMAKTAANASGPTPEIARLAGPRFVAANETEEGQRFAESMVKQLTGGDAVTARVLHGAPFDFVPVFKLWLAGNHRPVIRGDDHGIWRRMVMIGFDRKFNGAEQNKHLPDLLRKEYSGVLNWLIAGCMSWQKRGLDRPTEIMQQVEAYRSDMDLMQHWIDDMCCVGPNESIRAGAAYTAYKNWAIQNGHRSISNQKFAQKLKERGFDKGDDKRGAYYAGLAFRQGQI